MIVAGLRSLTQSEMFEKFTEPDYHNIHAITTHFKRIECWYLFFHFHRQKVVLSF